MRREYVITVERERYVYIESESKSGMRVSESKNWEKEGDCD